MKVKQKVFVYKNVLITGLLPIYPAVQLIMCFTRFTSIEFSIDHPLHHNLSDRFRSFFVTD